MAENELQKLIKRIFNHIKEKYGYTDEQALIYLQGYQDCAEENQQSLERRDKMLRDTVAELCEAKRLLKVAIEDMTGIQFGEECKVCSKKLLPNECPIHNNVACILGKDFKWRYADEALALLGKDIDVPASADDTNVGRKSGGWISCEDRLPSENTLVLCYARSTTGEGNSYFLGALALGEFWFLKVNDIGHVSCPVLHWEVTHWQPLPEPPKDGDTE